MNKTDNDDIKRVLLFQTAFLGDVVLSTPLFKNIKERFINASVTTACIPSNEPVLRGNPYIDSIITDDKKGKNKARNFFTVLKKIKAGGFDIVFSLHRSFRTALMLYLAGIPERVGFADSAGAFLYTRKVTRDLALHDVKRNLSILAGADIPIDELDDELLVTYSDEDKESLLSKFNPPQGKKIIVVSPGSVWATKRYPPASYASVISMLKEKGEFEIVLTGTKGDTDTAREIIRLSGGGITDLTGRTALKELAALLDMASLMITNDSGPMHIAASFNTPIVAIFGATTRSLGFYPYNEDSVVIEKELECRPCGKHGGMKCPIETFDCMKLITPEEVFDKAIKLLERGD